MGFREWIIPRDDKFFDLLEKQSQNVVAAAEQLLELFDHYDQLPAYAKRIEELEHVGDTFVHELSMELNRSFITPFDHSDIAALAGRIDDIIDYIDSSAGRMAMYKILKEPPHARRLAEIILAQVREVDKGVGSLRKMDSGAIQEKRIIINRLENEADDTTNQALVDLFELEDARTIMKLKEVYERLEGATDRCEDASDVLADIATKNA